MSDSPASAPAPSGCPCVRVPPISVAIAAAAAAVLLWTIARTVAASDFRFRLVVPPWSCLFGFYLPRSCLHKWAKLDFSPPWPHSWIFLFFFAFLFFLFGKRIFFITFNWPQAKLRPWQMANAFCLCVYGMPPPRIVSYSLPSFFFLLPIAVIGHALKQMYLHLYTLTHTHCELKYVHAIETKKWFMQQH